MICKIKYQDSKPMTQR